MKQNTVAQFVGFETNVELKEFVENWQPYSKKLAIKNAEVTLQQEVGVKNRFKYISRYECPEADFQFIFMKGRHSENFPESHVKVIQTGGYSPVQIECMKNKANDVKLMLFITKAEADISIYKKLSPYRCLNIYQAYYENCLYAYILEFFVEEAQASDLMKAIKAEATGVQMGLYKCLVFND